MIGTWTTGESKKADSLPLKMTITASDHLVTTEHGTLFARRWTSSDSTRDADATILLFHDSLGSVDLWRSFPEQLAVATNRSVVAYDRLGFGRSDPYPGTLPLTFIRDEAVQVVPQLCTSLGLDAIIPFGHSVGGAMAIATAATFGDRCVAAITESSQSFVGEETLSGVRAGRSNFKQPDQFERLEKYHGAKARWVLDAWIETWLSPRYANWSLDDELHAVRCPVLAIHGDRDEFGSVRHPERIARLSSGPSKAVILEGCGHIPHREQTARVLDEVTAFLADRSPAKPTHGPPR